MINVTFLMQRPRRGRGELCDAIDTDPTNIHHVMKETKMKPSDTEQCIRHFLERMFGATLKKRKLVVGYDSRNMPQIHEFDFVSDDMNVVGEIKSGRNSRGNYARALVDCVYLSRVKSKRKMLVLTDKDFFCYFKEKSEGVIPNSIEIILVCLEDLLTKALSAPK
jgi:hypothetical protein